MMVRVTLVGLLLFVTTCVVFWQVRSFDYLTVDDLKYVTENRHVGRGLSEENIQWAFTTTYFSNWHPLTWLSYMLDAQLFGQQNAGAFHLTNLLLHLANVLLLFVVLFGMTGALWKSAAVAALFAIHPLHVESVAWISERKDVLSTFFGLLAVGAYTRYARRERLGYYLLSLLCFTASLLSKQMLVTLPFLLLLLDYWPLGRLRWAGSGETGTVESSGLAAASAGREAARPFPAKPLGRLLLEKVPFLLLSIVLCVVAITAQQRGASVSSLEKLSLTARCLNAILVYVVYLSKTIWPQDLAVFYPHPGETFALAQVAVAALLLAAVTAVAIAQSRKRPYLLVGWLWYLGTLVPVIGIVQIGAQQMADRYTYVPLIGIFVAMTWLAAAAVGEGWLRRFALPVLSFAVLAAFAMVAWRQTANWRNSITLFEHTLAVTENNYFAHNNLGAALHRSRQVDAAILHYQAALRIQPSHAMAHFNLGNAYRDRLQLEKAIDHFQRALRFEPDHIMASVNLANIYHQQGRSAEAIAQYEKAILLDRENVEAHNNLGVVLYERKQFDEAIAHYRQALRVAPEYAVAHENLAVALQKQGRHQEARYHFQRVEALSAVQSRLPTAPGE